MNRKNKHKRHERSAAPAPASANQTNAPRPAAGRPDGIARAVALPGRGIALSPVDAWFFRDGRPFNQGDPAQMAIPSLFPPHPATVAGVVRAAIARASGWDGRSDWGRTPDLTAKVGAGDDLGPLTFAGPFLASDGNILFPAPLLLVGEPGPADRWTRLQRLSPGTKRATDLGLDPARLPALPRNERGLAPLTDCWLTLEGLHETLAGGVPGPHEMWSGAALFTRETRIGLGRSADTGTAEQGMLYSVEMVRPASATQVVVAVTGAGGLPAASPMPFGGEGRMAWIEVLDAAPAVPAAPDLVPGRDGVLRYTASLLTPAELPPPWPGPGGSLSGLPGTVVSACIGRPVPAGGWSSAGLAGPRALRPLAPAGSCWFMEASPADAEAVRARHFSAIGQRGIWGYGCVAIGVWRDEQREKEASA